MRKRNQEKDANLSAKVVTSVGSTLSLSPRFGLIHPEQLCSVNGWGFDWCPVCKRKRTCSWLKTNSAPHSVRLNIRPSSSSQESSTLPSWSNTKVKESSCRSLTFASSPGGHLVLKRAVGPGSDSLLFTIPISHAWKREAQAGFNKWNPDRSLPGSQCMDGGLQQSRKWCHGREEPATMFFLQWSNQVVFL